MPAKYHLIIALVVGALRSGNDGGKRGVAEARKKLAAVISIAATWQLISRAAFIWRIGRNEPAARHMK